MPNLMFIEFVDFYKSVEYCNLMCTALYGLRPTKWEQVSTEGEGNHAWLQSRPASTNTGPSAW